MRYRRLDLNLLVALEALLCEKSVTRAAAKLNMTQPAMSGALARMREYFEDPLVIQVGRHMELTPYAQSLVAPIHDIIMRIDRHPARDVLELTPKAWKQKLKDRGAPPGETTSAATADSL